MPTIRFSSALGGAESRAPLSPASSLLVHIMKAGAFIRHDCGGRALCGTCRIEVDPASGLSPMGEAERIRLAAVGAPLDGSVRLACQTHAARDVAARGCVGKEVAR